MRFVVRLFMLHFARQRLPTNSYRPAGQTSVAVDRCACSPRRCSNWVTALRYRVKRSGACREVSIFDFDAKRQVCRLLYCNAYRGVGCFQMRRWLDRQSSSFFHHHFLLSKAKVYYHDKAETKFLRRASFFAHLFSIFVS